MAEELLPSSIPKVARGLKQGLFSGSMGKPVFCANCGVHDGYVPEHAEFAFCLCNECADRLPPIPGTVKAPLEVFCQRLAEEQQEQFGRPATELELLTVLEDERNPITLLGKDLAKGR